MPHVEEDTYVDFAGLDCLFLENHSPLEQLVCSVSEYLHANMDKRINTPLRSHCRKRSNNVQAL